MSQLLGLWDRIMLARGLAELTAELWLETSQQECINSCAFIKFIGLDVLCFHQRFLALLCATAQQSYCRHVGVRRPSVVRP